MRRILRSPAVRIGALMLAFIAVYPTAYLLLPRAADGVPVTVVQCATVRTESYFGCQGTTVFRRTFTDAATVSVIHATLDGLHEVPPWNPDLVCNAGDACEPTQVYTFDLLWHGRVVRSSVASVHGGYPVFWAVRTLGLALPATAGSTTWRDLTRLTGVPVALHGVP